MARIYAGCLLKAIMESGGLVERSFKTQEVNFIHFFCECLITPKFIQFG